MTTLPIGKGAFIWQPDLVEGGDPARLVTAVKSAGFGHVVYKVANDTHAYPYDPAKRAMLVVMVSALKLAGIQVWGYGYVYLVDPAGEAAIAIQQVEELGLTGYYIDAEGEAKGKNAAATTFMQRLRAGLPNLPIALCSYRYPSLHPELPWDEFRSTVTFDAPQVYWVGAHDPVYQLNKSYGEFQAMTPRLPYAPVGAAYVAGTWMPTPGEWVAFLDRCRALGFSGANFWEWAKTKTYLPNLFDAIAAYSWPLPEPPPPEPDPIAEVLAALLAAADSANDKLDTVIHGEDILHAQLVAVDATVNQILAKVSEPAPPPGPTPEPEPTNTVGFRITEDPRCNARFYEQWNETKQKLEPKVDGAGKPIFMTYPSDTSKANERVQFAKDTIVKVVLPAVTGTGGFKSLLLVAGVDEDGKTWTKGAHGESLYVPKDSGTQVV